MSKKDMAEIRVFVKPELRQQFKSKCVLENKTMSDVIAEFMANYVGDAKDKWTLPLIFENLWKKFACFALVQIYYDVIPLDLCLFAKPTQVSYEQMHSGPKMAKLGNMAITSSSKKNDFTQKNCYPSVASTRRFSRQNRQINF